MAKKTLLNIFLLLFAAGLAFFIYNSEETSIALERLTKINANDIHRITISHNNALTTIDKSSQDHWLITQPIQLSANNFRISSILKILNAPVHSQYDLSEINTNVTGLDKPAITLQLNEILLSFGNINPTTKLRYVRLKDVIYTIEDVYFPLLSSHFSTLASLNLIPENSVVSKLILKNQTISKDERSFWQSNIKMSADAINKTIEHWQDDQAFGVRQYLQREDLGDVFIYLQERVEPLRYTITDTDPWLILARTDIGLEYHLDIEAYKRIIAPQ